MKLEIPTLPLEQKARLKDLIKVFLQIGATSFGSPTAHIAMMESEIVRKRKWLTGEHFLELLAATHLVPGPNATELALHIGYLEAGFPGLLAAGASFILPSFIATVSFAWAYTRYGALPQVDAIFYALNPLVLAIVINTLWSLGKSCLKTWQTWLIFGLAFGASLLGVNEVIILFAAGLLGYVLVYLLKHPPKAPAALLAVFPFPLLLRLFQQGPDWLHSRVAQLFLYFLRTRRRDCRRANDPGTCHFRGDFHRVYGRRHSRGVRVHYRGLFAFVYCRDGNGTIDEKTGELSSRPGCSGRGECRRRGSDYHHRGNDGKECRRGCVDRAFAGGRSGRFVPAKTDAVLACAGGHYDWAGKSAALLGRDLR